MYAVNVGLGLHQDYIFIDVDNKPADYSETVLSIILSVSLFT